jgi:hypothetical protein
VVLFAGQYQLKALSAITFVRGEYQQVKIVPEDIEDDYLGFYSEKLQVLAGRHIKWERP